MTTNEEDRERTSLDREPDTPEDPLLRREEAAAAREAAHIGGERPEYDDEEDLPASEAERPLIESGEGYEEGFEVAEDDLEEAASHEENRYVPEALGDEESAGDADVEAGEADEYRKPD